MDPLVEHWEKLIIFAASEVSVKEWVEYALSFGNRIEASEYWTSLSPVERILYMHRSSCEWNDDDAEEIGVELKITLTKHGKFVLSLHSDSTIPDGIGNMVVFCRAPAAKILSQINEARSAVERKQVKLLKLISTWRQQSCLADKITMVNNALMEVPPVCSYYDGAALQNFRAPKTLPSVHDSGGSACFFTENEVLGRKTPRVLYFVIAAELVSRYGPGGIEELNGVSLENAEELPLGVKFEEGIVCRRIEGITRRKRYDYLEIPKRKQVMPKIPITGENGAYSIVGFTRLVREVLGWIRKETSSDVVMTRGFRDLESLSRAVITQDLKPLLSTNMYSHYCWVTGGNNASDADRLHAFSSRMRYNSWHLQPWQNTKPSAIDPKRFHAAKVPDISSELDMHHPGHTGYAVRHALRVPFPLDLQSMKIDGFGDIRAMRQSGDRYCDEDLAACIQATHKLREYLVAFVEQTIQLVRNPEFDEVQPLGLILPETLEYQEGNGFHE